MFSVQQKRDISDAVQKVLRATAHPELPVSGEVSFTLKVVGAESWSYAEIMNNGAVGDPDVNPHNELMASIPEEEGRSLIEKAHELTQPDPRATPDEFMKEMLTNQLAKVQREVQRLTDRDKIKDTLYSELSAQLDKHHAFIVPIIEDNLIQHHSDKLIEHGDRLDNLATAIRQLGTPLVDKEG
jgi:hypothetical protein